MKQNLRMPDIDFGQPEAEHDHNAIQQAFYEAESWKSIITSSSGLPFVVGRKGSGKSALAARLEIQADEDSECSFLKIVPSEFRHVEIRELLGCLVNESAPWQYIYRKVWEGIVLGQLVRHFSSCAQTNNHLKLSPQLMSEIKRFQDQCGFYVNALDDALSDVITQYVRDAAKKTHQLALVELRQMLEPYNWQSLITALRLEFAQNTHLPRRLFIGIDGLDDHWDSSPASLYFLAQLLGVTKVFTSSLGSSVKFLVCLRDNIFRALVDTKSIEYDKIESLVINLEWNSRSLFEMIARRVAPQKKLDDAVMLLRDLLPEAIEGVAIDDYLGRHILPRPRDYINFFRMLQRECNDQPRAGDGHVTDVLAKYCSNRLIDLENEFGFIYPGISRCVASLNGLPDLFEKDTLIERLTFLCADQAFRTEAPELLAHYGQPVVLGRILVSIGVIGLYDRNRYALRFVHEYSESRVSALWSATRQFAVHPVYRFQSSLSRESLETSVRTASAPAIMTQPVDYLPSRDNRKDLEPIKIKTLRKREDLLADLKAIDKGQQHFSRYESWVRSTMEVCFMGDLMSAESQIVTADRDKRFEMIFDIAGVESPWAEIKDKYRTHRLLVECKNTDDPSESDYLKLLRDMNSLDLAVAFLAYRGPKREPENKVRTRLRDVYLNNGKNRIIIALSEQFFEWILIKKSVEKCRQNLNALWRDHLERWLIK
jgi:hypothetical protein